MNKLTWNDVTLEQFNQLQEVMKIEDETDRVIALAETIIGPEVTELSITEFNKAVAQLSFLKEEVPYKEVAPKKVVLNGRKYYTDCLLGNITTAQYVDFQNHLKTQDTSKILSCFVIPEGHKYNDGYDMEQVFEDIKGMPIPTALSMSFFFARQFSVFMRIFQRYSTKKIQDLNLPKETKKNLSTVVEKSVDMALYPLSSSFAK